VRVPGVPGMQGVAYITSTFRLMFLTNERVYDVTSLNDSNRAISLAGGLRRALGLKADGPVRAVSFMPFSARTRILKPILWLLPETLAFVALVALVLEPSVTLPNAAKLILFLWLLHNLCMLGIGLTQRRDARITGDWLLSELGGAQSRQRRS